VIVSSGGERWLVLIHTSNGQLQALNEADGLVKWTVNLDMPALSLRGESAPATAFGAAIVGGDNGRVSAVLMQQGQMIWQQRISQATGSTEIDRLSDVDTTPVIVNGVVYALAYNGNLTALDLRSGQIMWKRELGSVNDFIVDGNRIYMVDQNDRLLALTTEGGVTLWTQSDLLHRLLTAPALYNGLVVGDSEGYMHWIDPEDGRFVLSKSRQLWLPDRSGCGRRQTADPGKRRHAVRDHALITRGCSILNGSCSLRAVLTFLKRRESDVILNFMRL
jgi:outer membrane protein assembly factor BamB